MAPSFLLHEVEVYTKATIILGYILGVVLDWTDSSKNATEKASSALATNTLLKSVETF
jgi:hypothetical protein